MSKTQDLDPRKNPAPTEPQPDLPGVTPVPPNVIRGTTPGTGVSATTQAQQEAYQAELAQLRNARKALKEIMDVLDRHPELRLWALGSQQGTLRIPR